MLRSVSIRPLLAAVLACNALALAACGQTYQGGTATTPEPRNDDYWKQLHNAYVERTKKGDIDLLFLGDSITQGWNNNAVWQRYYGARKPGNIGIGGDRTQHVLWRLDNGEVDGISPRLVVLMIGTNNIGNNTPAEIAEGVHAIVDKLGARLPKSKVLLLGVFPRGEKLDGRPGEINAIIKGLADGKRVHYLDISQAFLGEDGQIPKAIMPDYLHLSDEGYRRWAEAIEPTLWKLLSAE